MIIIDSLGAARVYLCFFTLGQALGGFGWPCRHGLSEWILRLVTEWV